MANTQIIPLSNRMPFTGYQSMENHKLDWWPSDSEESFNRLMQDPEHRAYFQSKGWDQPGAITYEFNQHGFRSDEFEPNVPSIAAFGCSFTMGIGLPKQDVWPWLVGSALGLRVYNFSIGGKSADWCFRLAEYWVPRLRPTVAIMCAPPRHRFELTLDDATGDTTTYSSHETHSDSFIQTWFTVDENSRLNTVKNRLAFKALCDQCNIPSLNYDSMEQFARSREELEYARDHMHAGPRGHKMFAEKILNDWNEKYA